MAGGAEQPEIAHLVGPAAPHLSDVVHGVPRSPAERADAAIARDHQPSDLVPGAGVIAPVCRIAVLGRRPLAQGAVLRRTTRHGVAPSKGGFGRTKVSRLALVVHSTGRHASAVTCKEYTTQIRGRNPHRLRCATHCYDAGVISNACTAARA